jgi:cation diffusion facilitator family transporter
VAGAGFSLYEGLSRIFGARTESGSYAIAYAVLAFAALAEGASLVRAWRQTRAEAAERSQSHKQYVRASRDPTTKTVLFEDSAAVVGVVVAFAGVALHEVTGNQVYDGLASVLIAVLLATVAVALGRDTKALLVGEAATAEEREAITEIIEAHPAVDRLLELLTMALSPDRLLVAARVDLADGLSADEIERASSELDRELRERIPTVWQVFLDATPRSEVARAQEDTRRATGA